jgi:Sulfotransferase family
MSTESAGAPRAAIEAAEGGSTTVHVVYIMGAGRSGSTLLGILLGNGKDVFYAGELDAWMRRGGVPNGECGGLAAFWSVVSDRMATWLDQPRPDFFSTLEHPRSLLARRRRAHQAAYRRYNRDLYRAISQVAGASVVVDSSHFPLRRWHLRGLGGVEVSTILLVRDPRTLVKAFQKPVQKPKPTWSAALYVWVVLALSGAVYATLPRDRRIVVRYEDVLADPQESLARLARWLGTDLSGVDPDRLVPGTVFQGNRMRTQPLVRVDRSAAEAPPAGWCTKLLMTPWALAFGYVGRRGRGR